MEFYISWSHSDAKYCDYYKECPMLISVIPDNKRPLRKLNTLPNKLIIDSGGIFYRNQNKKTTVEQIFNLQVDALQDANNSIETIKLVQLDIPMLDKRSLSDKYQTMEKNLYFAWEYMNLFTKSRLPSNIQPMAVIQGFDGPSVQHSVLELKKMGYKYFGIGSLLSKNSNEQLSTIQTVVRLVEAQYLHIFGVTGINQIYEMSSMNISSFDSTRPTKAAAYYSVFYSNPFRTYILGTSRIAKSGPRLFEPLPCSCPVCSINPYDIFIPSPRHYMKLRSIHNYYHLRNTIQNIISQTERTNDHVVPNVLRP